MPHAARTPRRARVAMEVCDSETGADPIVDDSVVDLVLAAVNDIDSWVDEKL